MAWLKAEKSECYVAIVGYSYGGRGPLLTTTIDYYNMRPHTIGLARNVYKTVHIFSKHFIAFAWNSPACKRHGEASRNRINGDFTTFDVNVWRRRNRQKKEWNGKRKIIVSTARLHSVRGNSIRLWMDILWFHPIDDGRNDRKERVCSPRTTHSRRVRIVCVCARWPCAFWNQ